jgi:carbonic anhydrase/acetyltransferase-like protein (isoleucine patch superfamily)
LIRTFGKHKPRVPKSAFVHESAEVIGKVSLGEKASVYPLCVLRGDIEKITVGARSNIQDLTVIHTRDDFPTVIGKEVTVGHHCMIHGARIGDRCLIGMGAIVMEARVGAGSIIAAGALVPAGKTIPANSLVVGSPGRVVRKVKPSERRHVMMGVRRYLTNTEIHRKRSLVVDGDR